METGGVRTAKAMGLRNLPSKSWQVNRGWVIAANIAADLAAWTRLLGFRDDPDLREADPETLRYLLRTNASGLWKDAYPQVKRHMTATRPVPGQGDKQQRGEGRWVL